MRWRAGNDLCPLSKLWSNYNGRFRSLYSCVLILNVCYTTLQCSWDAYFARRNRGEALATDPPKQTEAFHNLLIQYHAYSCKLESLLDHYIQTYSLPQSKDFRLEQPKDPDDLLGLSLSLGELDKEEDDIVESDDSENPTNILLWHDLCTVCIILYTAYTI